MGIVSKVLMESRSLSPLMMASAFPLIAAARTRTSFGSRRVLGEDRNVFSVQRTWCLKLQQEESDLVQLD